MGLGFLITLDWNLKLILSRIIPTPFIFVHVIRFLFLKAPFGCPKKFTLKVKSLLKIVMAKPFHKLKCNFYSMNWIKFGEKDKKELLIHWQLKNHTKYRSTNEKFKIYHTDIIKHQGTPQKLNNRNKLNNEIIFILILLFYYFINTKFIV